jgi:acetyl esterase
MSGSVFYDPMRSLKVQVYDVTCRHDEEGSRPVRIYQPEGTGPFAALLDVHGGAWTGGSYTDNERIDLSLARSGLVVAAVSCRQAPKYTYPSQVADVHYASRWLKAHAHDFNAEAGSVGGLCASSGGHTMILSAMRPLDPRYGTLALPEAVNVRATPSYIIAAWPVLDPYARYLFAKEKGLTHLVEATESYFLTHDAMKEGNPLLILERGEPADLPPMLIIQGLADNNVPLSTLERFVEIYRAIGGVVEVELFQDMPHVFACKPGPQSDRALEIMKNFISRNVSGNRRPL